MAELMDKRRLIEYLPPFMRRFAELKELMRVIQIESDYIYQQIGRLMDNAFIEECDETTLRRYEEDFKMVPEQVLSVEERKQRILSLLLRQWPYTIRQLNEMLKTFCDGQESDIELSDYTLTIRIPLGNEVLLDDITDEIMKICPENLIINVTMRFNTHAVLGGKTHKQLNEFTHYELKNKEIGDD